MAERHERESTDEAKKGLLKSLSQGQWYHLAVLLAAPYPITLGEKRHFLRNIARLGAPEGIHA